MRRGTQRWKRTPLLDRGLGVGTELGGTMPTPTRTHGEWSGWVRGDERDLLLFSSHVVGEEKSKECSLALEL